LNISVACAVTLYEAYRQKMQAGHYNEKLLNGKHVEQLMNEWDVPDAENE
jgi:tRNA (guanosine-2'-O-)-methyltransferase